MADHRNNLFRSGDRWCSREGLERLEREASDDDHDAILALRRREWRCGLRKQPKIKMGLTEDCEVGELLAFAIQDVSERGYLYEISTHIEAWNTRTGRWWWDVLITHEKRRPKAGIQEIARVKKRIVSLLGKRWRASTRLAGPGQTQITLRRNDGLQ